MIVPGAILLICVYARAAFLFENDDCLVTATNATGKCINTLHCEYAKQLLEKGKYPQTCGFSGNIPLVCCPENERLQPGILSQKKCDEYFDRHHQVHAIDLGQKALVKEFPHMVAIGYGDNVTSLLWLCGGSLISDYFVLSAAHCVYSLDYGNAKYARLGDLDLQNTTEDASPVDMKIAETFVYPDYKSSSHYHDIALFKVDKRIHFGIFFSPACLHTEKNVPVDILQATGWGKVGLFGESSNHLMKVNLSIVPHEICAQKYATVSKRRLKDGIVDQRQMCAGNLEGGDTCPGDSGGPLHYRVESQMKGTKYIIEHFVVAGVTSFGKGCGGENSIGVYTRVSSYVKWIEDIVWLDVKEKITNK